MSALSAPVLGQLLLMQGILGTLPDEQSIFSFVCRGLIDMPGVAEVHFIDQPEETTDVSIVRFPMLIGNSRRLVLSIKVSDPSTFAPYKDFLTNFCFILNVILEERDQRRRIELDQTRLEQRVEERTKELQDSEARLKRTQEIAQLGSWELDVVNNILIWSDEAFRIFGLQPQEFGATFEAFLEVVHPDDREAVDAGYSGSVREGRDTYEIEHRVVQKSTGEIRYVHEKCEHIRDETGSIIRSVGMVHDITERKGAEEELREAKEAAEAASRAKSQFLANMSHELRTPMNSFLGVLQLLLGGHAGPLEAKQHGLLIMADKSARSLLQIISDILDLSKIEAGKLSLKEKPFSLQECVSESVEFFSSDAQRKGLDLAFTISAGVQDTVQGDFVRLRQILINLIGNAIKFTEQGRVGVQITAGNKDASGKREFTFTITDTGIGIPADKKHLLFRPFSQADDSNTRRYGGSGLGLAISRQIVELLGGTIYFESTEGIGSSFSFTIPLSEAGEEAGTDTLSKAPLPVAISPAVPEEKKPFILAAEDDLMASTLLKEILALRGLDMDLARTGREAVDMWERGQYDLILMDVQMPRMDGISATKIIREKEKATGGHIPIVAMTAHAFKEDKERCLEAGMNACLTKPLDITRDLELIMDLLKQ